MSLFNRLAGTKEITLTPQAGLLLAAVTMVAIDGDVDDDELAIIRRLDGSGTTKDWDAAVKTWKAQPLETCIELAAKAMDSDQQLVAIANLIDIAMADGILVGAEQQLLEIYLKTFKVDAREVEKIVDVIATKNNKSIFN
ncbi:MAG: hypothetical protein HOP36_05950 [Methyloglobulus sp.]|nr:hypothetical protein [Methyloglobulus sp.]